jgi:hypothetical protein
VTRGLFIPLQNLLVADQFASGLNLILFHPAPLGVCVGEKGHDMAGLPGMKNHNMDT